MFTSDNTEGYTQSEIDALNAEMAQRMAAEGIEPGTDAAHDFEKAFADEVAGR
jgi:hypothetical protein